MVFEKHIRIESVFLVLDIRFAWFTDPFIEWVSATLLYERLSLLASIVTKYLVEGASYRC